MNAAALGRIVAQRRRKAGLTQAELARRMGTKQPVISKIESGLELPTIPLLERIAIATGEPLTLVLGDGPEITVEERRRRVHLVTGGRVFNPWDREPTPAEARTLERDGLTRESFKRGRAARAG